MNQSTQVGFTNELLEGDQYPFGEEENFISFNSSCPHGPSWRLIPICSLDWLIGGRVMIKWLTGSSRRSIQILYKSKHPNTTTLEYSITSESTAWNNFNWTKVMWKLQREKGNTTDLTDTKLFDACFNIRSALSQLARKAVKEWCLESSIAPSNV